MATKCRILANAFDDINVISQQPMNISEQVNHIPDGFDYLLSNGDWLFKVNVMAYGSLKLKMTYFGKTTGLHYMSMQHYSGGRFQSAFFKSYIAYFVKRYGGLIKSVGF